MLLVVRNGEAEGISGGFFASWFRLFFAKFNASIASFSV